MALWNAVIPNTANNTIQTTLSRGWNVWAACEPIQINCFNSENRSPFKVALQEGTRLPTISGAHGVEPKESITGCCSRVKLITVIIHFPSVQSPWWNRSEVASLSAHCLRPCARVLLQIRHSLVNVFNLQADRTSICSKSMFLEPIFPIPSNFLT